LEASLHCCVRAGFSGRPGRTDNRESIAKNAIIIYQFLAESRRRFSAVLRWLFLFP
jgi:hypothetical protein